MDDVTGVEERRAAFVISVAQSRGEAAGFGTHRAHSPGGCAGSQCLPRPPSCVTDGSQGQFPAEAIAMVTKWPRDKDQGGGYRHDP